MPPLLADVSIDWSWVLGLLIAVIAAVISYVAGTKKKPTDPPVDPTETPVADAHRYDFGDFTGVFRGLAGNSLNAVHREGGVLHKKMRQGRAFPTMVRKMVQGLIAQFLADPAEKEMLIAFLRDALKVVGIIIPLLLLLLCFAVPASAMTPQYFRPHLDAPVIDGPLTYDAQQRAYVPIQEVSYERAEVLVPNGYTPAQCYGNQQAYHYSDGSWWTGGPVRRVASAPFRFFRNRHPLRRVFGFIFRRRCR